MPHAEILGMNFKFGAPKCRDQARPLSWMDRSYYMWEFLDGIYSKYRLNTPVS